MSGSQFETQAGETLENLFDAIESEAGDMLDADLEGGILSIELDDGRQYIINKHAPNRQIWLSSPVSGAHHFSAGEGDGEWVSTRGGETLRELLEKELSAIAGSVIKLGR